MAYHNNNAIKTILLVGLPLFLLDFASPLFAVNENQPPITIEQNRTYATIEQTTKENQLIKALEQNQIKDVTKLLKTGADPQKIDHFNKLPSIEISKLLLKNKQQPLDHNRFVGLILELNNIAWDEKAIKLRDDLLTLALENGANSNRLLNIAISQYWQPTPYTYRAISIAQQEKVIKLALDHDAKFSAFKPEKPLQLPSLAAATFMLNNSFDPNIFFNTIILASMDVNPKKEIELAKLAIAKGAIPQKIEHFHRLPSLDLSKLLLEKGLDPSKFLDMVLSVRIEDKEAKMVKSLIKLALKNGAKPTEANSRNMEDYLRN